MIPPLSIHLRNDTGIEIASGPFLGHQVGTISYVSDGAGRGPWLVNGHRFKGFSSALHQAMAEAYAYIARQGDTDEES